MEANLGSEHAPGLLGKQIKSTSVHTCQTATFLINSYLKDVIISSLSFFLLRKCTFVEQLIYRVIFFLKSIHKYSLTTFHVMTKLKQCK